MNEFPLEDFIEDFLQESNEHLQSINQNLLILEKSLSSKDQLGEANSSRISIINDLFRSFHTLKGLSGMVGLRPAEELSHLMEAVLREIQNSELEIDQEVIDRLFEGTKTLKGIVSSINDSEAQAPDIADISKSINRLLLKHQTPITPTKTTEEAGFANISASDAKEVKEKSEEDIETIIRRELSEHPDVDGKLDKKDLEHLKAAYQSGNLLYLVIFSPSTEKADRGKNVSQLRDQLVADGSILKSIPLINKDSVQFAFFVSRTKPIPVEVFQEAVVVPFREDFGEHIQPEKTAEPETEIFKRAAVYETPSHPRTTSVRVDLEKLDEILRILSDLVVTRSRINDQVLKLGAQLNNSARIKPFENLEQTLGQMDRNLRDLRAAVTRARMVPLSEVFHHMPLAVRDMTRNQKKEVRLILEGEQTQIDKVMVERLLDPLMHLVRNAITHGIETPAERIAAGKPAAGSLVLRGVWEGDQILIELADDGRGIDIKQVKEKAVELGLLNKDQNIDKNNLLDVISTHGFSTLDKAHLGAGRGIGMEVVIQNIRSIGGTIELQSTLGKGTIFRLLMPLTLTILDAIIVRVGSERYAVPRHSVEEVIEIDPAQIVKIESGELLPFRQSPLTLIRLTDLFHMPVDEKDVRRFGIICSSSEKLAALVVDQLVEMREVVVRAVQDPLVSKPGIFGATDLGDGQAVLILDVPALLFSKSIDELLQS
jgi:two-component system, chemotaxis family, sensor kinase CheA